MGTDAVTELSVGTDEVMGFVVGTDVVIEQSVGTDALTEVSVGKKSVTEVVTNTAARFFSKAFTLHSTFFIYQQKNIFILFNNFCIPTTQHIVIFTC